ncbi:UDP-N-acetylglucosamine--N-acetylmuramyl-(pentapeptide) pyrophosphoryl-undecaprenol N-acetylglucosamine transferase [Luteimonas sp. MHLX1A]|uniref:UDP-N-acetylglucosamine--N-acetylmuramyl- (pentapeptide) pyrophosphoryl-undecaprenol N-acetylglucosamine transferase n=1 Tax=Alterluteimonas muca TaxID=2878684 RepID=UPI001E4C7247|nr:UDP-N-acetylglucosamine--N-acetylmuramyl-(pentapeptide) pyrophosphoryl-undecaprenol N-acetylglucosamine transferase [Luteimonas sp. MHLX1A]MCD9045505.1 UDP-N-acetylglucosamine--N-acetylmuramyl-(pentapeptide) pyrophosphoryl-undecaprenol N-acetylglucosamine transferase [Luteimonas sp. MHLX1A]
MKHVIAMAAGGTGGHLFPAEALARELVARGHGAVIYTDARGARYTHALEGLPHVVLPARSLAGGIGGKLAAATTILGAAWRARGDLRRRGAEAMVGFGGYPSFAPALGARACGLPLLLHEQGTRLSLANRQLLRFASGVATSFADTGGLARVPADRVVETGNPVRQAILDARAPYPPLPADGPLRLLVVGGSQSAAVFGRVVPPALRALPQTLRTRLRLSLQLAGDDAAAIAGELAGAGIAAEVRPFFEDMGARLRDAHLVVTRAGATTIADLLAIGRPAIFVPIPQGGSADEQLRNARTLEQLGAGWCMPEAELDAAALAARLQALFASTEALPQAAARAAAAGRPDAAARLADAVLALVARGGRAA